MAKTATGLDHQSLRRSAWSDRLGITQPRTSLVVAAAASLVAATIHADVTWPHLQYWLPAGIFFAACTIIQVLLCASLLSPTATRTLLAAIATNTVVIGVYVVSRTAGIPGAPGLPAHGSRPGPGVAIIPGTIERVGSIDLLALAAEIAIVVLCASCLPDRARRHVTNALAAFGIGLLGLWWSGALG